jgi:hypothetical protein
MSTPRTRSESPAEGASNRDGTTAILEPNLSQSVEPRSDAELMRAIESTASRLLGLALVEERDPDEE